VRPLLISYKVANSATSRDSLCDRDSLDCDTAAPKSWAVPEIDWSHPRQRGSDYFSLTLRGLRPENFAQAALLIRIARSSKLELVVGLALILTLV
jgi:hypothetical protein